MSTATSPRLSGNWSEAAKLVYVHYDGEANSLMEIRCEGSVVESNVDEPGHPGLRPERLPPFPRGFRRSPAGRGPGPWAGGKPTDPWRSAVTGCRVVS